MLFFFFSSQWLQVNTPALLGRYSRCIQEAALNTANSTGARVGGGMGQGTPVRPAKLVLTRQSAFGGSKTSLGGPHSRAAGEDRLGEGQLFPALSDPGGGSSFLCFIPLPPTFSPTFTCFLLHLTLHLLKKYSYLCTRYNDFP